MPITIDPTRLYHGVFPGGATTSGSEDEVSLALAREYAAAAGRDAAWIYFSHNWYRGRQFPLAHCRWIRDYGAIPFIRLMLRTNGDNPCPDPEYTLANINSGRYDTDFRAWANAAETFGTNLIVEWGTEMNGQWFAWNAKWNGESRGAARFQNAYRRIVDTMRGEGANNITWAFHVNDNDDPETSWNRLERYYPGDSYVDWLGMSVYGAQTPTAGGDCPPFASRAVELHNRLHALAPAKPIFLLEFGATINHPDANANDDCDAAQWADAALTSILNDSMPHLRGFSWWNEHWENDDDPNHNTDMRVQRSRRLSDVFKRHLVGNPKVLDRPLA